MKVFEWIVLRVARFQRDGMVPFAPTVTPPYCVSAPTWWACNSRSNGNGGDGLTGAAVGGLCQRNNMICTGLTRRIVGRSCLRQHRVRYRFPNPSGRTRKRWRVWRSRFDNAIDIFILNLPTNGGVFH